MSEEVNRGVSWLGKLPSGTTAPPRTVDPGLARLLSLISGAFSKVREFVECVKESRESALMKKKHGWQKLKLWCSL
jgi:hypothetical protein